MKISVISPVYNVEDYLCCCIESVLQQTHSNFELILVDDGSTDSSSMICDQYSARYPEHIKTIHITNGGPFQARLIGILQAAGDVLVFLDADDCLRTDALQLIANCFDVTDCDMTLYNAETCKDFSSIQVEYPFQDGQLFTGQTKQELFRRIACGELSNTICTKAIRKGCTSFPDHFMEYTLRHGEDLLLSAHFITNCKKIVYLDEGLYHYKDRPGSAIHSFNSERKDSIKTVHTELEKYIDKWNMPELKPLHNARKVRGWIENLKLLLKHRHTLSGGDFCDQLRSMATDPYFRNAYSSMDPSQLSCTERILAFCLMKKLYFPLHALSHILVMKKE